ncbi:competence protein ComK [Allobacillus sp. GCM10007491]|uniref:Competence protein ComK n=2 Tax=Allobacillus TaxID=1400133 RepID=A0A941HT74_9BACI|nr:competence protein ComK [Allobacillus salarius]MBR7554138.1 competence protein ComK [Allobacillus saliphilus]TSJ65676.1 hypothetical protein FPQ13_06385 [Allobacillus salarius]
MTSRSIQKIQHYTINAKTLMICPDVDPHQCLIYEGEDLYLCESTSFNIVDQSCMSRGTTLDGRRQAVKSILENKHKPPIPIDTEKGLIFMPTKIMRDVECAWISYNHLHKVDAHPSDPSISNITFANGLTYEAIVSKKQLTKQIVMAGHVFGHFKKGSFLG